MLGKPAWGRIWVDETLYTMRGCRRGHSDARGDWVELVESTVV